ncbi:uncharacterized protein [Diadema antillarum]|uniref:uncharacterized protein n=1 Tax=Diadema antillarum TaxID=105358 RepID=UPI003A86896E
MNSTANDYNGSFKVRNNFFCNGTDDTKSHIEEFINRHLVCAGCRGHFQTPIYTPTLLPCLHSICPSCLEEASSGASQTGEGVHIVCPTCKQTVPSEHGLLGQDAVQLDYHADFLFEYLGYTRGLVKLCEGCEKLTTIAVACCSNCVKLLCKECLVRHQYTVGYSHQHFQDVNDLTEQDWTVFQRQQKFCVVHQSQALTLYCNGDDCKLPVCLSCCRSDHVSAEHNISDLSSVVEQLKAELVELLIMSENQTKLLEKLLENIDSVTAKLTTNADEATRQIKALFSRCHKVLYEREAKLLESVKNAHERMQQGLKQQKDDAKTMLAHVAVMSDCANSNNNQNNKVSLARVQKKLVSFFQEVANGTFYPLPLANSCVEFSHTNNEALTYFDSAVRDLGKVIQSDEVPFLTLVHLEESFVYQENIVSLEMTNLQGERSTHGGAMITAKMVAPSGENVECIVVDNMDGSYVIRFFPSDPGDHFLYVEVSREPIREKPIKVPVHALATEIKGENTDEECSIEIFAKDCNGKRSSLSKDLKFKADILDPQREQLKPELYYYPYGHHCILFRPKAVGEHRVVIQLNDVTLKCSPVIVPIHRIITCKVDKTQFFLENISGMTVTNMGKIFLADTIQNERVLGFTGHGECFIKIKVPYKGDALISKDRKDNLALLFPYRQVMIFYNQKGKQIRFFDTPQVVNPVSIAVTSADETLILECLSSSILVYNSAGILQTTVGGANHALSLGYPVSMSLDSRDNIYISNKTGGAILNLTWKGDFRREIALSDSFNQIGSVDCTPDGYILIHEEKLSQVVYVISRSSGNVLRSVNVHGIVGFLEHLGVTPDGCFIKLDRKTGCLRKYRYAYYSSKNGTRRKSTPAEDVFEVIG